MSPILTASLTALGGLLAGLGCGAVALHWQYERLGEARRQIAAANRRADHAEFLALHDDTTGIPNRRAFLAACDQALATGKPTGVVLLDLDNFKTVNDTYSHEHGNDVLTTIGLRLTDLGAPVVLGARLSGDEFALLIAGDHAQTRASAHAATAISGQPIPIAGTLDIAIRASVGYAHATDASTTRELLHAADLAMYEAKRSGTGVTDTTAPHLPPRTRCRDARHHPDLPATDTPEGQSEASMPADGPTSPDRSSDQGVCRFRETGDQ
ncbi:diguanylate cyclase [Actinoplanes sp. NPDC048791]|uniref:GGDEF domain-containing protein n=1 Tax=Actinoplanes sp. NPDC048791 TaxID=3154623 RepID=UPI0033F1B74F